MSPTLVTWLLLASTIALSATIAILLIPKVRQKQRPDLATCKARLEAIRAQLKRGELSEAEADAARLALLAGPQATHWELAKALRGRAGMMIVPAAAFLLAAGMGGAASNFGQSHDATDAGLPGDGTVAGLVNYTRSLRSDGPVANAPGGELLPDVSTMIGRLEARLEAAPEDVKGWRMLGWSYFHTGHYEQALAAFGKAVELDPQSAELKRLYEEAKEQVSKAGNAQTASIPEADAAGSGAGGQASDVTTDTAMMPGSEREVAIRSMVDGLANRLESSPRDVEGWTRLMRSRVVLGEKEVAATAFRKALEVFKDDSVASERITAAATELGLKAE